MYFGRYKTVVPAFTKMTSPSCIVKTPTRSGDHTPRCGPTHVFGHFLFYISTDLCQIIAFLNRPSRTCHRNRGHNHTGHPSHNRSHNDRPSHGHTYRPSRHHSNRSDWPADCGSWGAGCVLTAGWLLNLP